MGADFGEAAASRPPRNPRGRASLHPRHLRESYRYGAVLVLTVVSLAFQMAAPEHTFSRLLSGLLQAATLTLAFWASPPSGRRARRLASVLIGAAVVVLLVAALFGSGSLARGVSSAIACLLTAAAAAAIAHGVILGIREWQEVTPQAALGALTIYLLIGISIAFAYDTIAAIASGPIYAAGQSSNHQNDAYFSFITMTTVGYGDFSPLNRVARTVAVLEALFGQLYLVTIVALIVSNVGRRRRPAELAPDDSPPQGEALPPDR